MSLCTWLVLKVWIANNGSWSSFSSSNLAACRAWYACKSYKRLPKLREKLHLVTDIKTTHFFKAKEKNFQFGPPLITNYPSHCMLYRNKTDRDSLNLINSNKQLSEHISTELSAPNLKSDRIFMQNIRTAGILKESLPFLGRKNKDSIPRHQITLKRSLGLFDTITCFYQIDTEKTDVL